MNPIQAELEVLRKLNPGYRKTKLKSSKKGKLSKVVIANRGEIAKRFFLTLKEEGIPSVALVADVDLGQSWYAMADEVIRIGDKLSYINIPHIIAAIHFAQANAVFPGYGFLSESAPFVEAIDEWNAQAAQPIIFMGPRAEVMRKVGDKLSARKLAMENGVPVFAGSEALSSLEEATEAAEKIGYPVIVKLNSGGGGKGMVPVFKPSELASAIESAQRIGASIYNDDSYYLEKLIQNPVHMEAQIFNGSAIGIRKCAVQRRNQKIIEESGDEFLDSHMVLSILASAEQMARISGYDRGGGAGTVEFLYDPDIDEFGFLEMNTRLQVEHPVTDQSLGIDLAKWQVLFFDGREEEIPMSRALEKRFATKNHAIECRVYAEDPDNQYAPSPGQILELDLPTFNGIRCDFGFNKGDSILPDYDPMIGKIIANGESRDEVLVRLERALSELFVKGIHTNIYQLLKIVRSEPFREGSYNNRLLEEDPSLAVATPPAELYDLAAIFGAFSKKIQRVQDLLYQCRKSVDLERFLHNKSLVNLSSSYTVKLYGDVKSVKFLQKSLDLFYVFLDDTYCGELELLSDFSESDDYLLRFEEQTYQVRLDSRPSSIQIRFPDAQGQIHYFKMKVSAADSAGKADAPGLARAPFQGTFVGFADESIRIGATVEAGAPVIILSAMKMESTITAPFSGKITYLIEDGDLSRLQLSTTKDGKIIGRGIAEGEALFIIESPNEKSSKKTSTKKVNKKRAKKHDLDRILYKEEDASIETKIGKLFPKMVELASASYLGFIVEEDLHENLQSLLKKIDDRSGKKIGKAIPEREITEVILNYCNIKQLFSPAMGTTLSYFAELNQYFLNRGEINYRPSYKFKSIMETIFREYGISSPMPGSGVNNPRVETAFLHILRAHHATRKHSATIRELVRVLRYRGSASNRLIYALRRLIHQEESEIDNSIAEVGIETLNALNAEAGSLEIGSTLSRNYISEYKQLKMQPLAGFGESGETDLRRKLQISLKNPMKQLIREDRPEWIQARLKEKLTLLQNRFHVHKLFSPLPDVAVFLIEDKDTPGHQRYLTMAFLETIVPDKDELGHITGSSNMERANIRAAKVYHAYQSLKPLTKNYVEVITRDPLEIDLPDDSPDKLNYHTILRIVRRVMPFFSDPAIERSIQDIGCVSPTDGKVYSKLLMISAEEGKFSLSLLTPNDERNPYFNRQGDSRTQRLYNLNKWPIEVWAQELCDPGTASEIRIPSIDDAKIRNPKTGKLEKKKVGSRIYFGKVGGVPACFYMKDSRVSGGATGNREGLKYVAAGFLSHFLQIPLYIFNDGAGANIKEGMVSLNRAGEGFMLNTLFRTDTPPHELKRYVASHPDARIQELYSEMESIAINFKPTGIPSRRFIVAVGTGSSTGLDVYGSSQSAIQMMINSRQSYRVLTGANVIKSVMGEDVSNYDVGGAKVMSHLTGTVDLVAENKLHLLTLIRKLQWIFSNGSPAEKIKRIGEIPEETPSDFFLLNEELVSANVDDGKFFPLKKDYFGSGSLIGGFARIGRKPVMIMGTRTHLGIRSLASVIKAWELTSISQKTGTPQILVLGKKWYDRVVQQDPRSLGATRDFLRTLAKGTGRRIHILTDIESLNHVSLNSTADFLIFVKNREYNQQEWDYLRKSYLLFVDSLKEAFDLANQILQLFTLSSTKKVRAPELSPEIPQNPATPYDMKKAVIERVFDQGSFLEFYGEMNDPHTGPAIIAGLARLNGKTVGVLADQPAILGGAADAAGTEKFRVFTEQMNRWGLPLIMLNNAPGFIPGTKQERLRIQQIGALSLDHNISGKIPVVSVVLNQNYGGRQIHAFSRFLRPGIVYLALRNSVMAVMGAQAAFDLFHKKEYESLIDQGKREEAEAFQREFIDTYNKNAAAENDALNTGILDWIIPDIVELRANLIKGLKTAEEQTRRAFS